MAFDVKRALQRLKARRTPSHLLTEEQKEHLKPLVKQAGETMDFWSGFEKQAKEEKKKHPSYSALGAGLGGVGGAQIGLHHGLKSSMGDIKKMKSGQMKKVVAKGAKTMLKRSLLGGAAGALAGGSIGSFFDPSDKESEK